jgi:nucleotide-binding universal stress UspA family protein
MIRDIFIPLLRSRSDAAALDAAIALGERHQAHLSALVTIEHPMPVVSDLGYVALDVDQELLVQARQSAARLVASTRERFARTSLSTEVRSTETMLLWSEESAAMQARHADLTVLGGRDPDATGPHFALNFKSLLLQSGRPILMVPTEARLRLPLRRVVLAWRPTREATRALHDALPLLSLDTVIDVLMIDPQVGEGSHGPQPGADIAVHLARHGYQVQVLAQPSQGQSSGNAILTHLREADADLLVMGGYGHARWREAVLGGCTRTVLEGARQPVLFAH